MLLSSQRSLEAFHGFRGAHRSTVRLCSDRLRRRKKRNLRRVSACYRLSGERIRKGGGFRSPILYARQALNFTRGGVRTALSLSLFLCGFAPLSRRREKQGGLGRRKKQFLLAQNGYIRIHGNDTDLCNETRLNPGPFPRGVPRCTRRFISRQLFVQHSPKNPRKRSLA